MLSISSHSQSSALVLFQKSALPVSLGNLSLWQHLGLSWCGHAGTLTAPSFCDTSYGNILRLSERWCEIPCIQGTIWMTSYWERVFAVFRSCSSWTLSLCITTAFLSEMWCKILCVYCYQQKSISTKEMFLTGPTFHKATLLSVTRWSCGSIWTGSHIGSFLGLFRCWQSLLVPTPPARWISSCTLYAQCYLD